MMKNYILLVGILLNFTVKSMAQMPHDAIYMGKKSACVALTYGQSKWNNYWEGSTIRNNLNIGTHTTFTIMPMLAYGVTKRLNIIVSLPHISTHTSAGNLKGMSGLQDISIWAKYRVLNTRGLSLHAVGGVSSPVQKYVSEFLPMSIGFGAKAANFRAIINYKHTSGLFANAHSTYSARGFSTIDKNAYQVNNEIIYSNKVQVPDAIDTGVRFGYLSKGSKYQLEAFSETFACVTGDDIRKNDMPFISNNMKMHQIGIYGKIQPKNIGVNFKIAKVLEGKNTGESEMYSVGLLYLIK
jgi:hypothetical protein